jgi:hypothetical protein
MNKLLVISTALLGSACMAQLPPPSSPQAESQLADRLGSRMPTQPVSCIRSQNLGSAEWIDEGTLLFRGPAGTLYVNRTRSACPRKGAFSYIRTRAISSNICSGEIIEVVDRGGNISRGTCALGDFTPYKR